MRKVRPLICGSFAKWLTLALMAMAGGCAPPPELTAVEQAFVRRCLEAAYKEEPSEECTQQITEPMKRAFLEKHPHFYDQLRAERIAFVEQRLAEERRRRDQLHECLDEREAGSMETSACEKFMPHEIARELTDRRLRRCAQARLDGLPDAERQCEQLPERAIEDEMQMERVRRKRGR